MPGAPKARAGRKRDARLLAECEVPSVVRGGPREQKFCTEEDGLEAQPVPDVQELVGAHKVLAEGLSQPT